LGVRLMAPLVVLATAVAACGGDDGEDAADVPADLEDLAAAAEEADAAAGTVPAATPPIDTCALLEQGEVEAGFGERGVVEPGVPEYGEGTCRWIVGDALDDGYGYVFVNHYPIPGMSPDEGLDFITGTDAVTEPVDGLGEAARVEVEEPHVNVWFVRGSDIIAVSSRFDQPFPDGRDRVLELAGLVADRV
jgi:hypothetical protein